MDGTPSPTSGISLQQKRLHFGRGRETPDGIGGTRTDNSFRSFFAQRKLNCCFVGNQRNVDQISGGSSISAGKKPSDISLVAEGREDHATHPGSRPMRLYRQKCTVYGDTSIIVHMSLAQILFQLVIRRGDECVLIDNTDLIKWLVRSPEGVEGYVPTVVFRLPPPDERKTGYLTRLQAQFDRLRRLWAEKHRQIRANMVLNTMRTIRGWDLEQVPSPSSTFLLFASHSCYFSVPGH